jgi:hypothetical protein
MGRPLVVGHADLDELKRVEWKPFSEALERFGDLCGFGTSVLDPGGGFLALSACLGTVLFVHMLTGLNRSRPPSKARDSYASFKYKWPLTLVPIQVSPPPRTLSPLWFSPFQHPLTP